MSVLLKRSVLVLGLLFGLVFAVGTAVLWHYHMNVWYAVGFALFVVGLQYAIGPAIIGWLFKISWMPAETVSPELASFIRETCRHDGVPVPKFGVIEDGNPSAFTYGHIPSDARIVVTRGLIDMLNPDELKAVVAHEIGHITHWDFLVMTLASAVSLVLYVLYQWTQRVRRGEALFVGLGAYLAYILSQYLVLFLSRIREYYADLHSTRATRNPEALASALVTIAYGLARSAKPKDKEDDKKKKPSIDSANAVSALGFFSPKSANSFAMATTDASGNYSIESMRRAMRWDLYNPWARWFELNSTHPLPAKRIRDVMRHTGIERARIYEPEPITHSYTSRFIEDMVVALLPYTGAGLGLALAVQAGISPWNHHINMASIPSGIGYVLALASGGALVRTLLSYRSGFQPADIASLVGEVDVSHIRAIPVEIKGKIIGRGIPGLFWSEDLVIQDDSGFIVLDYRQPLRCLEFLFGWLKAESLIDREVVVRGWFRRGPRPYIEMSEAVTMGTGERTKCYYYTYRLVMNAILALVGAALILLL